MRWHAIVFGLVLVALLLLVGAAAFAQDHESSTGSGWTQIGAGVGAALASAVLSGASVFGAHRLGRPSSPFPEGTPELLARLDERTEAMQADIGSQGKQLGRVERRQTRQGNALLLVLARDGHSPEEQAALAALQDDSDDSTPSIPPDRPTGPTVVPP